MQVKVTDEMIARYLSGKATPEEEAVVLDYLSENDERVEDLLAMSAAVDLHLSPSTSHQLLPYLGEGDRRLRWWRSTTSHLSPFTSHLSPQRKRPLWPALSAAASVALLIGVGIAIWHNSGETVGIDPAPAYAEQDSIVVTNMEDTL